jgi:hypothetical protein
MDARAAVADDWAGCPAAGVATKSARRQWEARSEGGATATRGASQPRPDYLDAGLPLGVDFGF